MTQDEIILAQQARIEQLRETLQHFALMLVAALEDNWNCNPCETTRQQKAFDVAQSVLVKVRNP